MMSRALLCLALLLVACVDPPPSEYPTQLAVTQPSQLGSGDKIQVRIEYGSVETENIEREYRIDDSGVIAVPYIDLVKVVGRTPAEVRNEIKRRLADGYLKNPIVWVNVVELNSKRISIMGQVKQPNNYPYVPGMTILDAISRAGGFTPMARENAVTVVRTVEGGERVKYTVPVGDIQENQAANFPIAPGDVVNVPERIF